MGLWKVTLARMVLVVGCLSFASCGEKSASGVVAEEDLLPEASLFGAGCREDRMDEPERWDLAGDDGEGYRAGCLYKEPTVLLRVARYPDPSSCEKRYLALMKEDKGRGASEVLKELGVAGYLIGRPGKERCEFRFGNLCVSMSYYPQDRRDEMIRALVGYYEGVAK